MTESVDCSISQTNYTGWCWELRLQILNHVALKHFKNPPIPHPPTFWCAKNQTIPVPGKVFDTAVKFRLVIRSSDLFSV